MTNTDKHNQTTKPSPMNLDSLESPSSVSPPNMLNQITLFQPEHLIELTSHLIYLRFLFLSKRGMSRSPLAQEIMRDLLQKSSYW